MSANHPSKVFSCVPSGPPDPMNDLAIRIKADSSSSKIDLGAGVYRGEDSSKPFVLSAIVKAKAILASNDPGHEYEITTGSKDFVNRAAKLLFGDDCEALESGKIASAQTPSGTSANHVGAIFARKFLKPSANAYIGTPAWGNYEPLLKHAGFHVVSYRYYDEVNKTTDFKSILDAANVATCGSIFVLQGCCHNPTGADLSKQEWVHLASVMKARSLVPFFDVAYQGLGSGFDEDAWSVRYFAQQGFEMIVCQSFSKHMGLYGERVGAVHVRTNNTPAAVNILDQLRCIIRWEFSSPPSFGSRLATITMKSKDLTREWQDEVAEMRTRLRENRARLHDLLTQQYRTPGNWSHILRENGLFHNTGLSPREVDILGAKYHIYMPPNGRMNIAGLNVLSMPVVAAALDAVVRGL